VEETSAFVVESDARAMMESPTANADTTLQQRFAWVSASTGVPTHSRVPIGDQFAAFTDQLREWAELDLVPGLEGWPDDDWSDL
jgi:hypothetical protein